MCSSYIFKSKSVSKFNVRFAHNRTCNEDICAIHKMFVEVVSLAFVYVRFTTAWYNNPYPKFPIVNTAICYYATEYEVPGSSLEALCS